MKLLFSILLPVLLVIFGVLAICFLTIHFAGAYEINIGYAGDASIEKYEPVATVSRLEVWTTTAYSSKESCHYPAKGGCLTASGTIATVGRTVACPVTLKMGTSVEIDGKRYICEDRMAKRFSTSRFDVFMEYEDAKEWGVRKSEVRIIK